MFPPGVASAAAQRAVAEAAGTIHHNAQHRTPPRGETTEPSPFEPVGVAIRMVGNFIQVNHWDEQTTAARVTYELDESTATAVREAQYQQEYEHAAQQLSAELSVQVALQLSYLETEQRAYAQTRLSTLARRLAMEHSQTHATM